LFSIWLPLYGKLYELLVNLPPFFGDLILAGLLVVFVGAGDKKLPQILSLQVWRTGHFHPPAAALLAFVKVDLVLKITDGNHILDKGMGISYVFVRIIVFAMVKPVDEIPNHLGYKVACLLPFVVCRVGFIKADGAELIA